MRHSRQQEQHQAQFIVIPSHKWRYPELLSSRKEAIIWQVLSAEELAQCAMDNAANAMAAGRKVLSAEEALGQQANSTVLQGGSISDEVRN